MQLLITNILCLDIEESIYPVAYCKIAFTGYEPNYMINENWKYMKQDTPKHLLENTNNN